jgi:hypothetical protein
MFKKILFLFLSVILISCGGEEADVNSVEESINETQTSTEIIDDSADETNNDNTFDKSEKLIVGESYNLSEQLTYTADTYSSSDSNIASVSEEGNLSIHKAGVVQITAKNSSSSETTIFEIFSKASDFHFKSWVGENDSLIDFNDSLLGLTFIRSTEEDCQPILLINCGSYDSSIIDGTEVSDNITTIDNPGFYNFTFGQNTAATSMLSAEKFEVRSGEATIVFNNQLYLIGGYTTGDVQIAREYKSDVWVSKDGDEWLEINEAAQFSPRSGHQLIVRDKKLWLIGGSNGANIHSDVWVSENGKDWTEINQDTPFSMRTHFEAFTLNNELFIAGGYTTHGEKLNDLWRSTDGVNWSSVTNFSLAEASNSPFVVIGDIGSQTAYLLGDKIYSSTNGTQWIEIDDVPITTGFTNREAALINGEIWLFTYTFEYFGSRGHKNISRVYKSKDALTWEFVKGGIYLGNLIAREAKPIEFKDRLFIVGGRAEVIEYTNEVWSTTDGNLWIEHTLGGFYGPRHSHAMVSHNGMLYSTGGVSSENISTATPYKADVWQSEDGLSWDLVQDQHAKFRARSGHNLISIGDKLCYIGGYGRKAFGTASGYRDPFTGLNPDPAGSVLHVILFEVYGVLGDIACSTDDGIVWKEVVPSTDDYFKARKGFSAVNFKDKIWIIGGKINGNYYNDVWSTEAIEQWDDRPDLGTYGAYFTEFSQVSAQAAFSARTGHATTVHNDELYLSAGKDAEGFYLDDLWKSSDGVTWTLVNDDMGDMDKRAYHQMVSFDDKLWIIAGRANYHETLVYEETTIYEANDIWVSEDNGITWQMVVENAPFEQRQNFQAVAHNDSLYISGGTGGDGYVTVQGKDSILNDVWRSEDGINWRTGLFKKLALVTEQ